MNKFLKGYRVKSISFLIYVSIRYIYVVFMQHLKILDFIYLYKLHINVTRRIIYIMEVKEMTKAKEYKHKLNLTVDREIKEYLKIKAIKENTTVSAIITEIVEKMMSSDKRRK